jgi:hypothetical protein
MELEIELEILEFNLFRSLEVFHFDILFLKLSIKY